MAEKRSVSMPVIFQFTLVMLVAVLALGFVQTTTDQADERTALQMILSDLERDSVELTAQLSRGHRTEAAVMSLLRSQDRDPPIDSVIGTMVSLFYFTAYEQLKAGYLNLLNAGRLTVISDADLRQSVVDYFEITHPYMWRFHEIYMDLYWALKEATAPYMRMVPEPEGDVFVQSFRVEMARPWAEMMADPMVLFYLEQIGGAGSQYAVRLAPALERNAELRAAILGELGM